MSGGKATSREQLISMTLRRATRRVGVREVPWVPVLLKSARIDRCVPACYFLGILMISRVCYCSGGILLALFLAWPLRGTSPLAGGTSPAEPKDCRISTGFNSLVGTDFDGDMKPDVVVETAAGRGHVLQIRFSSQIPTASLAFDGTGPGVRILSRDVNRDNDADLIITSCTSPVPIAVFLGDGKGHFQPDNPWNYVPFSLDSPYQFNSPTRQEGTASNTTEDRRISTGVLIRDLPDFEPNRQPLPPNRTEAPAIRIAKFVRPFRGPPGASPI